MTWRYNCCLLIRLRSFLWNFWKPVSVVGTPLRFWALHLWIMIWFHPDIVDHILSWRWKDVIQMTVAVAAMHRCLGTRCAVGLLATINDTQMHSVVWFDHRLYPSGSNCVIEDWNTITSVQTTICIGLLPAAPKVSNFPPGVWQTSDCSIDNWQNGCVDNWCDYRKYPFLIPRPGPCE